MFIKAVSNNNYEDYILINKDHIKYCRTSWSGTKGKEICTTRFYAVNDEVIGKRIGNRYGGDHEMIVDTLTTTIVPVAGAGFSMVHIRGEDEGYDKPTLEEIPISAFRVYDEYGVPIPVVVDDDSTSMPTSGTWGIKMPNGRVMVPYHCDFDSVEAFMADAKKKALASA